MVIGCSAEGFVQQLLYSTIEIPMRKGAANPPGFYEVGGGHVRAAEWVTWWMPFPDLPNVSSQKSPPAAAATN